MTRRRIWTILPILSMTVTLLLECGVLAFRPASTPQQPRRIGKNNNHNSHHKNPSRQRKKKQNTIRVHTSPDWVESQVKKALRQHTSPQPLPSVRDCNSALAFWGDRGDLLRALRLFGKMRKIDRLTPTVVTYSTLMSRAVKLSKPRVALRLWDLMMIQLLDNDNDGQENNGNIVDIKAANIRMNCWAKLANVPEALDLLEQIRTGRGPDIRHALEPNLVTFNTVLHACQRAGDLDTALRVVKEIKRPDARTYTILIATVARRPSEAAGRNDPSLAFHLLQEMTGLWHIKPNGMTYSALIDACGRCSRSDLALRGLRIMLRQKARDKARFGEDHALPNEVGAWTAAITACGKAGRLTTAMRLFRTMPSFGVLPNKITCASLTDSLLREGQTADTLEVLRYMKGAGLAPSEFMYTSLMSRAETLLQFENDNDYHTTNIWERESRSVDTKAIEVYTELMQSLLDGESKKSPKKLPSSNSLLVKVFLVFQQMKAAGAKPDRACYNALLRACARAGDFAHAQSTLDEMMKRMEPNDTSWREVINAAAKMGRSDLAQSAWKQGMSYVGRSQGKNVDGPRLRWEPSAASFGGLVKAHVNDAEKSFDANHKTKCYRDVARLYNGVLLGDYDMGLDRIDVMEVLANRHTMFWVLAALVSLTESISDSKERQSVVADVSAILELGCWSNPDSSPRFIGLLTKAKNLCVT